MVKIGATPTTFHPWCALFIFHLVLSACTRCPQDEKRHSLSLLLSYVLSLMPTPPPPFTRPFPPCHHLLGEPSTESVIIAA